jgi:hypothetical protein
MGVEDLGGLADLATQASEVASEVLTNGQEFLSDGFNQLQEQVTTFAGDSTWFNSNFIGDIIPTDFTTLTNNFNFDSLSSFTSEFPSLSSLTSNIPSIDSLTSGLPSLSSSFPSLSKILPNPSSIADSLVKQVQNTAISLATNTVKQAVASVVPPALQPYANQAINSTVRSIGSAVSSTIPGTPGFVGPPAPSTVNSFLTPTNAGPSFQQFDDGSSFQTFEDGSTLAIDADGKPTSSPAPADPPVPTTQTFDDGSTLTTYPDGTTKATPAPADLDTSATPTNYGATTTTNPDGSTTQTFDDGSTLTTAADGKITATPSPTDDPQSLTRSLAQAANSIVRSFTPGTVNDPSLATQPLSTAAALAAAAALIPGGTAVTTAIADAAARAQGLLRQAQNQQTARIQSNNNAATGDWRVRLQLANASDYLYNAPDCGPLLWPLRDTDGVIFPYTPSIDTAYKANYTQYDLTHSNYRGYFYQNSYVDTVNIKATFTAQDTAEANYLLAVIHFFRSVTKMFYGQDAQRGSPPPLVFLSGLGDFQFNRHPCVVSQFNYNLPADVNYIRAQSTLSNGGNQLAARTRQTTLGNPIASTVQRLASLGQKIFPGAVTAPFAPQGSLAAGNPTYVPTKMEMNLSLLPIQSRSQVSQQFSVRGFANGNLLKGGFW